MSLLSWNCRGLRNLRSVNALKEVVKREDPNIVFLMETKSNEDWIVMVHDKCRFKHGFFVSSNGSSGELAMLWKEEVQLNVQMFSMSHINAWVDGGSKVGWWYLFGFYGNPKIVRRPESWAKLKHLRTTSSLPWLVIGDFNELMGMSEKEGGSNRPK